MAAAVRIGVFEYHGVPGVARPESAHPVPRSRLVLYGHLAGPDPYSYRLMACGVHRHGAHGGQHDESVSRRRQYVGVAAASGRGSGRDGAEVAKVHVDVYRS